MPSLFDSAPRAEILARLGRLTPDAPRRWGRMTARQMVAHLSDQMRHSLGDAPCRPVHGILRNPLVKRASIYWVRWPRGRIKGPPDAFLTPPGEWAADRAALVALVERFGARDPADEWPEHALFGPMTGNDWGFFVYKHFDHHLTQFGA